MPWALPRGAVTIWRCGDQGAAWGVDVPVSPERRLSDHHHSRPVSAQGQAWCQNLAHPNGTSRSTSADAVPWRIDTLFQRAGVNYRS